MPSSVNSPDVRALLDRTHVPDRAPFPSPQDWRDVWIYFILLDRFNNPAAPPRSQPWDGAHGGFQGGTLDGVRQQLDYLKDLGAGAIWLSPVLKNPPYDPNAYHGYGIHDFLNVEPRFTSDPERARQSPAFADAELRALVDAAHERGLYVVLDVVLNHAGDVFAYADDQGHTSGEAPWRDDGPYSIRWRDENGQPRPDWAELPANPPHHAAIWPRELQGNEFFRRQGNGFSRGGDLSEAAGDFYSLKELNTALSAHDPLYGVHYPVRKVLTDAYAYLMIKFDIDGYRLDTLKYVEPEFARTFGNAMREFALSLGKRNFFTFGEVYDGEDKIARFIGRNPLDNTDLVGVDAALDFPLYFKLPGVVKGQLPPSDVIGMFEYRKQVQRGYVSSHGEASKYFVTFLDNHDQGGRFRYVDPGDPARFDGQFTMGLTALFTLQGIPCLYYGTEQGLHGSGSTPEAVREALWGKAGPDSFDRFSPFYHTLQKLSEIRDQHPALRYGRQYFRPVSGDGVNFGVSPFPGGVLAYSRMLAGQEVLIVANTNTSQGWAGKIIVDYESNEPAGVPVLLFSNVPESETVGPGTVDEHAAGTVWVDEVGGAVGRGPTRAVRVVLQPMEVQVLFLH